MDYNENGVNLFQVNLHIAYQELGSDYMTRKVVLVLLIDGLGWTISGIADYLRIDRKVVRRAMRRMRSVGILDETPQGIRLSDYGREFCRKVQRQAVAIASGGRAGFSEDIVTKYEALSGKRLKSARTLRLPNPGLHTVSSNWPVPSAQGRLLT